jgi:hypothetical protein
VEIDAREKGSISFLKKRNKKLLFLSCDMGVTRGARRLGATDKSFLVLFFKKELLPLMQ